MENQINITSDILERSNLLNISAGMWTGKSSQTPMDLEAQGATTESSLFLPGHKMLVAKKTLEPFIRLKSNIANYLQREARKFYIRSTWIVSLDAMDRISDRMQQYEKEWNDQADLFCSHLAEHKQEMLAKYEVRYGIEFAASLETLYPSDTEIRNRFVLNWTFGRWSFAQVESAAEDLEIRFKARASSFLDEMEQEIYESTVEAAAYMVKGIDTKLGMMSEKRLSKFRDLISRIRNDNASFLNSDRINQFLNSVDENVINTDAWKTEELAKERIKRVFSEYVSNASTIAEKESETGDCVRRVSSQDPSEIQDEDEEAEDGIDDVSENRRQVSSANEEQTKEEGEDEDTNEQQEAQVRTPRRELMLEED